MKSSSIPLWCCSQYFVPAMHTQKFSIIHTNKQLTHTYIQDMLYSLFSTIKFLELLEKLAAQQAHTVSEERVHINEFKKAPNK